jgi:Uri superfamily endonuclease
MADSNASLLAGLPAGGAYRLTIRLDRRLRLRVGALGVVVLPAGSYVYCGSARRNLPARVARHLRRRKPRRWHIDYLLAHAAARVYQVHAWPRASECSLVRRAVRSGGRAVVAGFGSSDCRRCPAHLIYMAVEAEPQ